ncbi:MAG TPA: hypothetical protein VLZ89_04595, partial [Anaerolineales bacterium]|nr:hypothetical protein [Anaerolineales bacterium]
SPDNSNPANCTVAEQWVHTSSRAQREIAAQLRWDLDPAGPAEQGPHSPTPAVGCGRVRNPAGAQNKPGGG